VKSEVGFILGEQGLVNVVEAMAVGVVDFVVARK
jgi:hypothetical protein